MAFILPELEIKTVIHPSNTKLRLQAKQARAANKNGRCTGALELLVYYNAFSVTGMIYIQDWELSLK